MMLVACTVGLFAGGLVTMGLAGLRWGTLRTEAARPKGTTAFSVLSLTLMIATALGLAFASDSEVSMRWGGGLMVSLEATVLTRTMAVLVVAIAAPVTLWAAGRHDEPGTLRLLGGILAFVGAMELLVLAGDLLTLLIGWELVGALSWALIGHRDVVQPRHEGAMGAANYAFNVTRLGDLGLFVSAGAMLASVGTLDFDQASRAAAGPHGDLFVGGIVFAALAKSAQLPFSPWLFRAMKGPPSVSALLHSSTMVAAGAWILVRLHPALDVAPWFGPTVMAWGLTTAAVAGVVACLSTGVKRLLAASTCAHFGLAIAAVGAAAPDAALSHVITHAGFKALLFLAAGSAIALAGTKDLFEQHVGRVAPWIATASGVGVLALAGVPGLSGGWSKEHLSAALHHAGAAWGLATMAMGALSAWYGVKFQRLAFGRREPDTIRATAPEVSARVALGVLVVYILAQSAIWIPAVREPVLAALELKVSEVPRWERWLSGGTVLAVAVASAVFYRRGRSRPAATHPRVLAEDWLGLTRAIEVTVVVPARVVARALAACEARIVGVTFAAPARVVVAALSTFEARVVEGTVRTSVQLVRGVRQALGYGVERAVTASVRGVARGAEASSRWQRTLDAGVEELVAWIAEAVGAAGRRARALQTGALPMYYTVAIGTLVAFVVLLELWRR